MVKHIKILILLLAINIQSLSIFAQSDTELSKIVDTTQFKLFIDTVNTNIQLSSNGNYKKIPVPWEWVMESKDKDDTDEYVSSLNYDKKVTAFAIGADLIGFHLSSYEVQRRGSAQAAAGRDIFLVYIPSTHTLYRGNINLGVTKKRIRFAGCFSASYSKFLLSDINNDGYIDVGVVGEELKCETVKGIDRDIRQGPYYDAHPVRWYVFSKDHWEYAPRFDRRFPRKDYWELPLIGLVKSPVDYVKGIYRKSN